VSDEDRANGEDLFGMDPSIIRGLTDRRISRREVFRYGGAAGLAAFLAACGVSGSTNKGGSGGVGSAAWWKSQKVHQKVNFANWAYYIDTAKGTHPSLDHFTQETGIKVTYTEPITDNIPFYTKIRPSLQAHQYSGFDIIVMTNNSPALGFLIDNGWLVPLDQSAMTNFIAHAGPLVKNPSWDPGNKYTMAWQSGWTAMAYNTSVIKEPITSVQSLFDPKYKGKIGMPEDPQELGSIGLNAIGVDPAKSTPADWRRAAKKLQEQKPLVYKYDGQPYITALKNGETTISWCWSGDIFQANLNSKYRDLKLVFAKEGAMFWTDNMCIPVGVENARDAMMVMDYYYKPSVQAVEEYYCDYVCPVPDAQKAMLHPHGWVRDALNELRPVIGLPLSTVAHAPTIFPTPVQESVSKPYYQYKSQSELDEWNSLFVPITQ
jgi:spermidine/putrescine transport system substrate-binding protein